ncbi:hypothetical protein [Dyadobacter sp.]
MKKQIKIDKPMPEFIKAALKEKQEWKGKIQSGETKLGSKRGLTIA